MSGRWSRRVARTLALVACLLTTAFAGCLRGDDASSGEVGHAAISAAIGEPIDMFHDHTDAALHTTSHNLDLLAWSRLDVELGQNGFANFVFYEDDDEDLVFIAVDGDLRGGFTIADVSDPLDMRALGNYRVGGSGFQEVRVTPDGAWALMNVQETPNAATIPDCGVCIHVVDVRDRANPRLSSVFPVELVGTHNLHVEEIDGGLFVFYVGQPTYRPDLPFPNPPPGNEVNIAQLVTQGEEALLVKVAEYRFLGAYTNTGRAFPHDVYVAQHPLTQQFILYASWWDGGAITVDVSDPLMPRELDVVAEAAPSGALAIHWYAPEPEARGERLIAYSAPEIGELSSDAGVIRSYDVSDPENVQELGFWELPGEVTIPGAFLYSPHITIPDMERGLLAVSHYHAGVWVLDITDPTTMRALAYYQPHGDETAPYAGEIWWKKPNFDPEGFLPNVYQARWKDELLWASERGTGLYVLEYTGPVPGPVTRVP